VRRPPLRFLAQRLNLDERQVRELARFLDELKTERAQAEVDRRRTLSAFATLSPANRSIPPRPRKPAPCGPERRTRAPSRCSRRSADSRSAHAEQRRQLAYLIRTGTIAVECTRESA